MLRETRFWIADPSKRDGHGEICCKGVSQHASRRVNSYIHCPRATSAGRRNRSPGPQYREGNKAPASPPQHPVKTGVDTWDSANRTNQRSESLRAH